MKVSGWKLQMVHLHRVSLQLLCLNRLFGNAANFYSCIFLYSSSEPFKLSLLENEMRALKLWAVPQRPTSVEPGRKGRGELKTLCFINSPLVIREPVESTGMALLGVGVDVSQMGTTMLQILNHCKHDC